MSKIKLDHCGEFDEFFAEDAKIHVERMNARAIWIGIDLPDGGAVHMNTGIEAGVWFFNVSRTDSVGGVDAQITRPSCHRKHAAKIRGAK